VSDKPRDDSLEREQVAARPSDVWIPLAFPVAVIVDSLIAFALRDASRGVIGAFFVFAGAQGLGVSVWRIVRPTWRQHPYWSVHPRFANWFASIPFRIAGDRGERINGVLGSIPNAIGIVVGFGLMLRMVHVS
jgi:hypothetical protein